MSTETSAPSATPSCVLAGSESLLLQCGALLIEKGWAIQRVVSKNDEILDWAREAGIEVCAPGRTLAEALGPVDFDYFFSITNLSIISDEVLALPKRSAINFHDGPLPAYAGMYTPAWAILNGESEYGVTFHEMTGGVDEGRILVQKRFELGGDETSLGINTSCYAAAIEGFEDLIGQLATGQTNPTEQDFSQRSYYGRHQRPEGAGLIDFSASAEVLSRWVRAMDFGERYANPFCAAKIAHGGELLLVRSATLADAESTSAGALVAIGDDGWTVGTGDGAIRLSGFTCPRGIALTPQEAAARVGLSIGQSIGATDALDRTAISTLNETLTPSEAFWVRRLASLDAVEAPYRSAGSSNSADGSKSTDGSKSADGSNSSAPVDSEQRQVERFALDPAALLPGLSGSERSEALIAGFAVYLSRLQGVSDFDLTWSEDALHRRIEAGGPLYSKRVPMRLAVAADATVSDVMTAVRTEIGKVRDKGTFLIDAVARDPRLSAHPILSQARWTSVTVGLHADSERTALPKGSDLGLFVSPSGDAAHLAFDRDAIDVTDARRILDQLSVLLRASSDDSLAIAKLPLLADDERSRILYEWNQTAADFDRTATVASLFAAQVERTPDATALVFESEELSYRELDERATRLAHHLVGLGIGPDRLVGLHLARSADMLVGVLGVLKAGGAYVPLDPVYPEDRISYMIEDSKASVVVTHAAASPALPSCAAEIVDLDRESSTIATRPTSPCETQSGAENLAYVIYTSGSTGKPKGVMVEHRNAVNFFVGMDERVPHDSPGNWLAVTSLSFDISVLELLWTLTRGFKVVVFADHDRAGEASAAPWRPIDMGLALWGSDAGPGPRKYELMLESAKFADERGFCAVHTPERHFGAFGGPFPNPSVTGAAIAAVTKRVQIRASSCVLPLHHPIRVAEEWAVVDNISNGRVGISFASGWQPNDFVIRPSAFANAKTSMFESAEIVRRLWRGDAVEFENPNGTMVPTATLPRPVQEELPVWITTAGNVETFRAAGAAGVNVLTHLLGQPLEDLEEKIVAYRQAAADAGHDPKKGVVTCMLHTFVGADDAEIRRIVREPMKEYLGSAMALVVDFAWSFPAFERPGGPDSKPEDVDLRSLSGDEIDAILEFAFERYYETSGLFGTPEVCERMLQRCKDADIDEIACLIDFGVDTDVVLGALEALDDVRKLVNERPVDAVEASSSDVPTADHSFAAQVEQHSITHLQCTPSHATMLLTNPETRGAFGLIPHLMIGGEAFPVSLAAELDGVAAGNVTNMYGPTETTIWSSTQPVAGSPETISIGTPIANTQLYILDAHNEPLPVGVAGELWIAGEGVVRGYHERSDLTDERFVPDPFSDRDGARMYRTGDLARWTEEGRIDFLGRLDHQVKIRGYRIELGEIEARLAGLPGVREAVVIAREDVPGDVRLVGYVLAEGNKIDEGALRDGLREHLPEFMVPSNLVRLDRYPQTPNGKVDRKALPAPNEVGQVSQAVFVAPESDLEAQIAMVWREVLYLEQVGVNDNFFDLGGHSLLVVQAHRKLAGVLEVPITLTDLYRFPTIAGLAERLSKGDGSAEIAAASQERGDKRRQALGRRRRRGGKKD